MDVELGIFLCRSGKDSVWGHWHNGACTKCTDCWTGVCQAVLHDAECCSGASPQVDTGCQMLAVRTVICSLVTVPNFCCWLVSVVFWEEPRNNKQHCETTSEAKFKNVRFWTIFTIWMQYLQSLLLLFKCTTFSVYTLHFQKSQDLVTKIPTSQDDTNTQLTENFRKMKRFVHMLTTSVTVNHFESNDSWEIDSWRKTEVE